MLIVVQPLRMIDRLCHEIVNVFLNILLKNNPFVALLITFENSISNFFKCFKVL